MKKKVFHYAISLSLLATFCLAVFNPGETHASATEAGALHLQVRSNKNIYIPGEPVALNIRVHNRSAAPVSTNGADVWHGDLKVMIAYEGQGFKEYVGPQWGLRDVANSERTIPTQGFFETEATILYNHTLETNHLSGLYASQAAATRIESEYALAKPGTYRIKVVLYPPESQSRVESEPVQVSVEQPQGDDLVVWNRIKDNSTYGYFIQTGDIKARANSAKAKRVVETLEEIVKLYPESKYVEHINRSLTRFRTSVEHLKEKGIIKQ